MPHHDTEGERPLTGALTSLPPSSARPDPITRASILSKSTSFTRSFLEWFAGPLAAATVGATPTAAADLTLAAPVDYQVAQRSSRTEGTLAIKGEIVGEVLSGVTFSYRLLGPGQEGGWRRLEARVDGPAFAATAVAPAGGWWRLEVHARSGEKVVGTATVAHVGIGEVFVIAGQSNSANHGEERQKTATGLVATFDGTQWRPANDPQPGASGDAGSFLPPFGDAMAEKFKVPVGIVACGVGATSVREWLPKGSRFPQPPTLEGNVRPAEGGGWESKGTIYEAFIARASSLGRRGFRAVLWHQGESDANQADPTRTLPGNLYRASLEKLILESRRAIGWEAPWFVAQASYHVPGDEASPDIRAAQASLWKDGLALEGPDTDALKGDLRDSGGKGVHFSGPGLRAHAAGWVDKVAPWLEARLSEKAAAGKVLSPGKAISFRTAFSSMTRPAPVQSGASGSGAGKSRWRAAVAGEFVARAGGGSAPLFNIRPPLPPWVGE